MIIGQGMAGHSIFELQPDVMAIWGGFFLLAALWWCLIRWMKYPLSQSKSDHHGRA
jgi:hypothetical protein